MPIYDHAPGIDASEDPNGTGCGADHSQQRLEQLADELAAGRISLMDLSDEEPKVIARLVTMVRERRRKSLLKFIAEQIALSLRAK